MSIPLLATKLFIPRPRPDLVRRDRLLSRLNDGAQGKLTLISAPAGFGKTTLISTWIAEQGADAGVSVPSAQRWAAWLSLDVADSDPTRFLTYFVAAIQTIAPDFGSSVTSQLQAPPPLPLDAVLTALVNELATITHPFLLVLDDYHRLDAPVVDEALTFLLDHLPPQMQLIITTREDPPLPLARLRVRGELNELRAADLRFSPAEATEFLSQIMGLDLSVDDVSALEKRTEGWIAGLQLAALSMRGRDDIPRFVQAFAGDNRYIVDYLVEEVLQRQPADLRNFLLQTAILDRLNGALCDAVTEQTDSSDTLETLERSNLFVIPLDDTRHWYRYHHLFADVLYAHLRQEQPDQLPILHQRASRWHEEHGLRADAIRHALAAEDYEHAAALIELAWPEMDGRFQAATWLEWAKLLPDAIVRQRPVLSVAYGWADLNFGNLATGEAHLRQAEELLAQEAEQTDLQTDTHSNIIVVDETQFQNLPASIASARAFGTLAQGDVAGAVRHGRRALELLLPEDHVPRGQAAAILGIAEWRGGDLLAAHHTLTDAMAEFQAAGQLIFALSGTYGLADILLELGQLRAATHTYAAALQLATEQGEPKMRGLAELHLGLSEMALMQGELSAALAHFATADELGEQAALGSWPRRLPRFKAQIKVAQGDDDAALALLDEATHREIASPLPDVQPINALKARIWLRQGRLDEAQRWVAARGLTVGDDLAYLTEFEHITLARLYLALYQRDGNEQALHDATHLLDRLMAAAQAGNRITHLLEILLLQARAYDAQDRPDAAQSALERALRLAAPERYVAPFVREGDPIATLLRAAWQQKVDEEPELANFVTRLLATFGSSADESSADESSAERTSREKSAPAAAGEALPEPLSERELDVLRLLKTELTGPEIAKELMVSLNTMRTHTKNIYAKLTVNSRRAAVRRADELGL